MVAVAPSNLPDWMDIVYTAWQCCDYFIVFIEMSQLCMCIIKSMFRRRKRRPKPDDHWMSWEHLLCVFLATSILERQKYSTRFVPSTMTLKGLPEPETHCSVSSMPALTEIRARQSAMPGDRYNCGLWFAVAVMYGSRTAIFVIFSSAPMLRVM